MLHKSYLKKWEVVTKHFTRGKSFAYFSLSKLSKRNVKTIVMPTKQRICDVTENKKHLIIKAF